MPPTCGNAAGLDRAVAEIAARQRALNGETPSPARAGSRRQPRRAPAALPRPRRCRRRTCPAWKSSFAISPTRSRRCASRASKQAINALRDELGEIGRTLTEAMPRRAIEAIEKQIQGLTSASPKAARPASTATRSAGIEHGLAEVRDALHGLTPAENLVGFNEAVANLAHKIDLIVAQKDPATMRSSKTPSPRCAR